MEMTTHEMRLRDSLEYVLSEHDFMVRLLAEYGITFERTPCEAEELALARYLAGLTANRPSIEGRNN